MNRFLAILMISLIGCSEANPSPNTVINEPLANTDTATLLVPDDSVLQSPVSTPILQQQEFLSCDCNAKTPEIPHRAEVGFSGYKFNLDSLNKWKSAEGLKVKTLLISKFDTIPEEFGIFKNVEFLILASIDWRMIQGLSVFPKLKGVEFRGKTIDLSDNPKWLAQIEVIHAQKSKIIGLKSFKSLPKLKELRIAFSGFDVFPSDFESMKCLQYFQTGAHTHGEINLAAIDLSNMPCLEFVEFQSWDKNMTGIPVGIDSVRKVKVHHGNLTEDEKLLLKKIPK
ncbi:MAG: hypothetical protein JKY54_17880 [Flavobacteriales bacterium]|nr:hypothetical protein [Flavobacteriales bacterium]